MLKPEERKHLLEKKEDTLAKIRIAQERLDRYDYLIRNNINVEGNTIGRNGFLKTMRGLQNTLKKIEDQLNSGKFNVWD